MTHDAVADAIGRSALFSSLDPGQRQALATQCRVRRYAKGEQIFARGDPAGGMFLLCQGSVALSVTSADGGEVVLAVLRPPQTFGELGVIDGGARVATATVRQASVSLQIPPAPVMQLLNRHPQVALSMMSRLAALVRRIDDQATDLVLLDLHGRVVKFLLMATDGSAGESQSGFVPVDMALSQTEIAQLVGGSRQQVNRLIVALEAAGAVRRSGARIVGVRPDLLAGSLTGTAGTKG